MDILEYCFQAVVIVALLSIGGKLSTLSKTIQATSKAREKEIERLVAVTKRLAAFLVKIEKHENALQKDLITTEFSNTEFHNSILSLAKITGTLRQFAAEHVLYAARRSLRGSSGRNPMVSALPNGSDDGRARSIDPGNSTEPENSNEEMLQALKSQNEYER